MVPARFTLNKIKGCAFKLNHNFCSTELSWPSLQTYIISLQNKCLTSEGVKQDYKNVDFDKLKKVSEIYESFLETDGVFSP